MQIKFWRNGAVILLLFEFQIKRTEFVRRRNGDARCARLTGVYGDLIASTMVWLLLRKAARVEKLVITIIGGQ